MYGAWLSTIHARALRSKPTANIQHETSDVKYFNIFFFTQFM